MIEYTRSTQECFYEIFIESDKKINYNNYDLVALTINNNICGVGEFMGVGNYIIAVSGNDYVTNNIDDYPFYTSNELSITLRKQTKPKFVLLEKDTNKKLILRGEVSSWRNYSFFSNFLKIYQDITKIKNFSYKKPVINSNYKGVVFDVESLKDKQIEEF